MNKLGSLLLGMFIALPVYAQDQPADDTAAPAEAAPADAAPADATPADATASDATASDAAPADAPASDAAASDAAPAADEAPADAAAAPASDAPAADAAAGDTAAPADAAATESAPADGSASADAAAPADASAAPADGSTEAASTESAPAEEAAPAEEPPPAEERKPWQLYAGYDYALANFLASSPDSPSTPNKANQFSSDNLHGKFHQIRAGVRVFDVIGIEAHYGIKAGSDDQPDTMAVKNNMGLYFVPTGTLFDVVEISALIGYASTKMEHAGKSLTVRGSSYGANLEVPLRPLLGDWMPDIRLGGGFMVYHHDRESRIYGSHFGARWDFKV